MNMVMPSIHGAPSVLPGFQFSLDLPVRNEWRNVDLLRTSVQNCIQAVFSNEDVRNTLAMVTGELLENAMKYGHWTNIDPAAFRLVVHGGPSYMRVTVQNPVRPGDRSVVELLRIIAWIQSFDSPEDAYRARLIEISSTEDWELNPSKLGLVRVAYEGNCALAARIDDGILTVTATMRL